MPTITPHLWYDTQAVEAANFYTSLFPDSEVTFTSVLKDTPSGDAETVAFTLWGTPFMAISAGPHFTFNPSISFMVNFDPSQDAEARTRIDDVWEKLADGGFVMMELGEYPYSPRYGWVADRYGLSWQLMLTDPEGEVRPPIIPSLMFVGDVYGKTEEATDFYMSIFADSKRGTIARFGKDQAPDKEGAVMFTDFTLLGQWFAAMESAHQQYLPAMLR
jgi:predicted 3-demethylubiquinone-9 3-methyltransferase (glyoxalase superfamily)